MLTERSRIIQAASLYRSCKATPISRRLLAKYTDCRCSLAHLRAEKIFLHKHHVPMCAKSRHRDWVNARPPHAAGEKYKKGDARLFALLCAFESQSFMTIVSIHFGAQCLANFMYYLLETAARFTMHTGIKWVIWWRDRHWGVKLPERAGEQVKQKMLSLTQVLGYKKNM